MPAQGRAIDQHGVILDHAIVTDVGVGHDEQVAANFGEASALRRAAINGHKLADFVVIADLEAGWFAFVSDVLRRHTDGAEGKESVVGADSGRSFDGHMRRQTATFAKFDVGPDHAIGPDLAGRRNLRARINQGRRMYVHGS